MKRRSVAVFCGARMGAREDFAQVASRLGKKLGEAGHRLVYGGGHVGLMGLIADATLSAGGEVTGVIPSLLMDKEVGHRQLTDLRVVSSMHERKALMENLSDIFVTLPGGFGTMDELNEIITWRQLGIHKKPIVILNHQGFYDYFLNFIQQAIRDGFISQEHMNEIHICTTVEEVMMKVENLS